MHTQQPISKWWPIGLGITYIILFAVGGGLLGNDTFTDGYTDGYTDSYIVGIKPGMYYSGIAICALGACAFIAFIIMIILYFIRRKNSARHVENGHSGVNYAQPQTTASYQQTAMAKPESVTTTNQMPQNGTKVCGNCGSSANSKFCAGCGAAVPGM